MSTARPGPVVVGVDASAASQAAVVQGAWEAERRGVAVLMVYGYLVPTPCLTPLAPLLDDKMLLTSAEDRLAQIARTVRVRRPRLPIITSVVRAGGDVALVKESATASLVVVGPPRFRGFTGLSIGSVARQVMAKARCPVLVTRRSKGSPAPTSAAGSVLIGVDTSPVNQSVLRFGFEEAAARGVPLVAAHVCPMLELARPDSVEVEGDPGRAGAREEEHGNELRKLGDVLAPWQERYPEVDVRRQVIHGSGTARALLDVAHAVSADLLVVGSRGRGRGRGRGPVAGAVLGSVSQVLISHAGTPVAVIGPLAAHSLNAGLGLKKSARA